MEHLIGEAGQIGQAEAEDSDVAEGEMSGKGRGGHLGRRGSLVGVERRRGFPGGRERWFRGEWTRESVEAGASPGLFLDHSGRRRQWQEVGPPGSLKQGILTKIERGGKIEELRLF
jgi:hypothetical protein